MARAIGKAISRNMANAIVGHPRTPIAGVPAWLVSLSPAAVMGWDFRTDQKHRLDQYSFSRASVATMENGAGGRQTSVAGVLRRIDGLGIVLERAAASLQRNSETMVGTGWSAMPTNITRTGNATDGFTFTINADETGVFKTIESQYDAIAVGVPGYFSFDLHDSGTRGAAVWVSHIGYVADFDTQTGVANGNANTVVSMASIGGGWWRCRARITQPTSAGTFWRIKIGKSRIATNYLAGDFYRLRAPQVELERFSSYIPTTLTGPGSTARAADALVVARGQSGSFNWKALLGDNTVHTIAAALATDLTIDPASLNRPDVKALWAEAA